MFSEIRKKREERVRLMEQANGLITKASAEKRELTQDESDQFDRLEADAKALKVVIDRLERGLEMQAEIAGSAGVIAGTRQRGTVDPSLPSDPKELSEMQCRSFTRWAAWGDPALNEEDRRVLAPLAVRPPESAPKELRDQGVGTTTLGGFTVPQGFFPEFDQALKLFGSVMAAEPRVIDTDAGNDIPLATVNDTGNVGELLAEHAPATEQDLTWGQVILKAFYYSSKLVEVSWELLQDSAFDFGQVLAPLLGERIGRITNTHFTTGTGTGQPQGVVTFSTLGKTAAGAAAITYLEWIDLETSVDPAYRAMGAKVMTSDLGLAMFRKVLDGEGRPIFQTGPNLGDVDRIGKYPVVINQDIAVPASAAKSVLFGAFSKYFVRRVRGIELFRITEPYITKRQTGFVAFARLDGRGVNAGTNPIKHLVHT